MAPVSLQSDNAILELLRYERFRQMIEYLCKHKDELLTAKKAQIVFNCAGPKVKSHRTIHDD